MSRRYCPILCSLSYLVVNRQPSAVTGYSVTRCGPRLTNYEGRNTDNELRKKQMAEKTFFATDMNLLAEIRPLLAPFTRLYWLIGGAGTGKSTLSRALAAQTGIPRYDMDEHSFGDYGPRYTAQRHPATTAWFTAENPFGWMLSHNWENFAALYRASNVEMLDLFTADLQANYDPQRPLLVDGGITHPALLAQVLPPERIICLAIPPGEGARLWQSDPERRVMLEMTLALPDGEAAWRRFLDYDQQLHDLCVGESRAAGIVVLERDGKTAVDELTNQILQHWELLSA